jgi:hypothetical protein
MGGAASVSVPGVGGWVGAVFEYGWPYFDLGEGHLGTSQLRNGLAARARAAHHAARSGRQGHHGNRLRITTIAATTEP